MAQAGAVNGQGSYARGEGSVRAQWLRLRYGQGLMAQGYWQSIKTGGAGLHWVVAQAIGGDSDTGS